MKTTKAANIKAGQWLYQRSGAYLVDGITVTRGLAYIGTVHGICVVPADREMVVSDASRICGGGDA